MAVIGAGEAGPETLAQAERVGELVAEAGAVLVCGGLGGVMEAACRGAAGRGGLTIGLVPGEDAAAANPYVAVVVPTGLGQTRNALVVRAGEVVVAVGGAYGTLSELAFALTLGRPVVGLGTWALVRPGGAPDTGIVAARDPDDAVAIALALAGAPG